MAAATRRLWYSCCCVLGDPRTRVVESFSATATLQPQPRPGSRGQPLAVPGSPVRFQMCLRLAGVCFGRGCVQRAVEGAVSLTGRLPCGPSSGTSRRRRVARPWCGHSPGPSLSACPWQAVLAALWGMGAGTHFPRGALPSSSGAVPCVCSPRAPQMARLVPDGSASVLPHFVLGARSALEGFTRLCRYGSSTSVPPFELVLKSLKPDSRRI